MKRSEMLDKLTKAIAFNRDLPANIVAEGILELIEEAGMKPPLKERCAVLLTDKHVWEKENG